MAGEIKKASKSWESSGANSSQDSALSAANHSRGYRPMGPSGSVSGSINADCAKMRGPVQLDTDEDLDGGAKGDASKTEDSACE